MIDCDFYLDNLCESFGQMFELIDKNYNLYDFYNEFINSSLANHIENRNIKYLSFSAKDMIYEIDKDLLVLKDEKILISPSFWAGWILIQYQIYSSLAFKEINNIISLENLISLYYANHEAPVERVFEIIDERRKRIKNKETNLKKYRELNMLSQKELSNISNVDIRSIQMYEQKRRDINKASISTLLNLSKSLNIHIEDLLENY